jgi:polar amino acid transport system substrate-binding protein
MHGVWLKAFFSGLFCLLIGLVVYSCQWRNIEDDHLPKPDRKNRPTAELQEQKKDISKSTIEVIKERAELRVGMHIGLSPFEMVGKNGEIVGLDVDLAQMTAHELGVGLRIVKKEWAELIPALLSGEIDVIMSAMTVTPDRNSRVIFCDPILSSGRMFALHRNNADRFRKLSDINKEGVFVVTGPGGPGPLKLESATPKASFRSFPTTDSAVDEILKGRAHVLVDHELTIRELCAKHSQRLTSSFSLLTYEPIAWAIRPKDCHWLNWLNNYLRILRNNGTLEKLKKKWLRDYYLDMTSREG